MESVDFTAYISVSKRISYGKVVGWIALVALSAIVVVDGALSGRYAQLVVVVVLAFAIGGLRGATSSTEMRRSTASALVSDGCLRLFFPGTRLMNGRYVDQCYICRIDAIADASVDQSGFFHLRAERIESYAMDGETILAHGVLESSDVSFKADSDAVRSLLLMLGENDDRLKAKAQSMEHD